MKANTKEIINYFLFDNNACDKFTRIVEKLAKHGVSKVSYNLYLPNNVQIKSFLNPEIFEHFIKEDFNNNCPILKICKLKRNTTVLWKLCNGSTKNETRMMDIRKEMGLYNGITIATDLGEIQELVGWASHDSENDVGRAVIEHLREFYDCAMTIRKVALKSTVRPFLV